MSDTVIDEAAPTDPDSALTASALEHHQAGRLGEAVADYRRLLALGPQVAAIHYYLASALHALGRLDEASAAYDQAIALEPDHVSAHYNLGILLQATGRLEAAAASYRRAAALKPDHVNAHNNLGGALAAMGRPMEAAEAYGRVVALAPDFPQGRFNLGNALLELDRLDAAMAAYHEAVRLDPAYAEAYNNLGNTLQALGRIADARAAYGRAAELNPGLVQADSNRLLCMLYDGAISPEALLQAHRDWDRRHAWKGEGGGHVAGGDPERRLRIGYVSADLYRHPVGWFLAPVLAAHDPAAVEVFCYSNGFAADDMTARLRATAHHWRSLVGVSDETAARMIRQDRIDILVDLSGHTGRNRLGLFSRRPAPVQVSWLGYPGTTGLAAIDYLIMDAAAVPPGAERWCSEAVVRLGASRFCYAPPAETPPVARAEPTPGAPVVFGSFNNLTKVGPEVVALWAEVLAATPGSRLVLKWKSLDDPAARRRVVAAFAAAGLAEDRLELRGASPHPAMLAQYADIDIAMDPFPFCGGLTSCEALWMGTPVVTLPGERPASRQTLGFLEVLGLADLAAGSPADYVRIAAAMAADPERRARLCRILRPAMAASTLVDGRRFTPMLEAALRTMWRRWNAGAPAAGFDMPAPSSPF